MPSRPAIRLTRIVGVCVWLWVAACAGTEPTPAPRSPIPYPQVPNPAARKCLDDGFELKPVLDAGGVPVDHDCIDQRSGKRCEVWDYFRGDCRLREAPQR